jgi:hypothetical protein
LTGGRAQRVEVGLLAVVEEPVEERVARGKVLVQRRRLDAESYDP